MKNTEKEIWTIGHSSRPFPVYLELLQSYNIGQLVDVRRYPGSRKFPFFNKESLKNSLPEHNISYLHLEDLGGRRKPMKESNNKAWRHLSFRGYADYMESAAFKKAATQLMEYAEVSRVAYMCSEAVWWSCHRALISDYLKIRGWKVNHIMNLGKAAEHPYTKPARIIDGKLDYSPENQ